MAPFRPLLPLQVSTVHTIMKLHFEDKKMEKRPTRIHQHKSYKFHRRTNDRRHRRLILLLPAESTTTTTTNTTSTAAATAGGGEAKNKRRNRLALALHCTLLCVLYNANTHIHTKSNLEGEEKGRRSTASSPVTCLSLYDSTTIPVDYALHATTKVECA